MDAIDKLVSLAGPPLGEPADASVSPRLGDDLAGVLARRNGFYAFESALHVFPVGPAPGRTTIELWNDEDLWRGEYSGMADGHQFFAEDVFGGQFSLCNDEVFSFEPESGEAERIAASLDEWASLVLADLDLLTGFPLAHEWQLVKGALPEGSRLLPKLPFVLGGEFAVDNLYLLDAAKGMRLRGELATQLRDLPDGATVKFHIID